MMDKVVVLEPSDSAEAKRDKSSHFHKLREENSLLKRKGPEAN